MKRSVPVYTVPARVLRAEGGVARAQYSVARQAVGRVCVRRQAAAVGERVYGGNKTREKKMMV